ncbi:MAG: pilin [Candidatus Staskawiczbacteria bacterium]|nr:pilin [Candidatus Staskawiczbacteria bacterium]
MDKKINTPRGTSKTIIFLGLLFAFFLKAGFVLALEIHYPDILGQSLNDTSTLQQFVCYFFGLGMNLAFFIAVISIAFGGISYLVSYGRGKFTDEGKDWIKAGVTGLLIIVCASLIIYTINPAITTCKLGILSLIPFGSSTNSSLPSNVDVTTFNEIPIGTLTENLLTRKIDCYDFDQNGNPIDGEKIDQNTNGPTFLENDRADCLTKLIDGAQKKAQVVDALSAKITKLMNTCSCSGTDPSTGLNKCKSVCDQTTGCYVSNGVGCPAGNLLNPGYKSSDNCSGACKPDTSNCNTNPSAPLNGACQVVSANGTPDCCPKDAGLKDEDGNPLKDPSGKIISVKYQIEHGPAGIAVACNDVSGNSRAVTYDPQGSWASGTAKTVKWNKSSFNSSGVPGATDAKIEIWLCAKSEISFTPNISVALAANKYCSVRLNDGAIPAFDNKGNASVNFPDGTAPGAYYFYVRQVNNWDNKYSGNAFSDAVVIGNITAGPTVITYEPPGDWLKGKTKTVKWDNTKFDSNIEIWLCTQSDTSVIPHIAIDKAAKNYCHVRLAYNKPNTGDYQVNFPDTVGPGIYYFYVKKVDDNENTFSGNNFSGPVTVQGLYNGLDEFRCPNPIKGDEDASNLCDGRIIKDFVETTTHINNKTITLINQENWKKLNLLQQEKYFKEKIASWKDDSKIQDDINLLNRASSALGKCYLAIPYVDLLKTYESTNQQNHIILKDPETFSDPVTNSPVEVANYCQGFNYNNSSCLKKCNNMCPDTSQEAMQCYKTCGTCDGGNPECLASQQQCVENCSNSKPCALGYPEVSCNNDTECPFSEKCDTFTNKCTGIDDKNFGNCMTSCQKDCSNNCAKEYSPCSDSDQYKLCQNQCKDNGQCVLDNPGKCLFGAENFVNCANQITDQGNANFCISNAYLCKNGSDNYAGNKDLNISASSNCPKCPCATGSQCNENSHNDDPLTFYCQDNWWTDQSREGLSQTPIGTDRVIELKKEGEVPVGQTVDNAIKWAKQLIENADTINKNTQKIIDKMMQIGTAKDATLIKNYCKCNAKFDSSHSIRPCGPICITNCSYWEAITIDGCFNGCSFVDCQGNPCGQIIDYLAELSGDSRQFKTDFLSFNSAMLAEPRSDIINELAYSRKTANDCSLITTAYGIDARLLSCTRVEQEIIPPITTNPITFKDPTTNKDVTTTGCYGIKLGKLSNKSLTDNWFCASQYSKNTTK